MRQPEGNFPGSLDYARDDERMVAAEIAAALAVTKAALHVSNSCALPLSPSFFFSPDAAPFFFKLFGSASAG
jgi:hypothetical protein